MILLKAYKYNLSEKLINEIIDVCNKYSNVKKVVLFGSRARKDNSDRSDIDLAVYFNYETNNDFLFDLSEIETLLKVDITVISSTLDEKFLANIEKEGVTIWENTKIS